MTFKISDVVKFWRNERIEGRIVSVNFDGSLVVEVIMGECKLHQVAYNDDLVLVRYGE